MANPSIRFKRGSQDAFSSVGLQTGEPAFITDEFNFYIGVDGTTSNNKFFGSHRYWSKENGSKGSGINLVEATGGSDYITLAAPASVGAAVTYYFPATQGVENSVLTNDGSGNLTWGSGSSNAVFTGITTFSGPIDANSDVDISGITTFSNLTNNTLGDSNTGAVQINGGLGVGNNTTIAGNLYVDGYSEFIGIVTVSNGAKINNIRIGVSDANTIDTVSGNLSLNSAGGTTIIDDRVEIQNNLNVTGNVTIGGTTLLLNGLDIFIRNKDIILGYTTSVTGDDISDDDTANHAGVAIASTEGSPLVSFVASGINTLPDTYKQLMWFKSGTLGFSTDAFAFNYGVAIGTTTMADGVRLAVGSGITMNDTDISATNFYGTLSGSASSAEQVRTITASDTDSNYYLTFVDSHNGTSIDESIYTDDGIYYNPGTNKLTTQHADFTGDVNVSGITTLAGNVFLGDSGSDVITIVGVTTFTTSNVYIDNQLYVGGIQIIGGATITGEDITARHLNLSGIATITTLNVTGTTTLGTGVGVTQFSSSVSTGSSTSSVPTSSAVIDYVNGELAVVDLTLGLNADSGGPSTVSTSETLTISGTTNEIETSVSGQTVTVGLPDAVVVGTSLSAPTVKVATLQHSNGTQAATIDSSGNITASQDLTISGDLYVNGSTTQVNTTTLTVEDNLIELAKIDGSAPGSDANKDVGMLLHYYDDAARLGAVFWDDSTSRIVLASRVGESSGVLTVDSGYFAPVEIGALWVNDCAGQSQVISCTGTERFLENITVDGGQF